MDLKSALKVLIGVRFLSLSQSIDSKLSSS